MGEAKCAQCRNTGWQIDPKTHIQAGKEWWYGLESCEACELGQRVLAGEDEPGHDPYAAYGEDLRIC